MSDTQAVEEGGVWREVTDALLAGVTHDLNGRVSALRGLLLVLGMGGDSREEALRLLQQEGERLEAAVAALRLYPRGAERTPEAMAPRELLESVLALHARREDQAETRFLLEVAAEAPAARAERSWLTRALLVLLARAGAAAQGAAGAVVRLGAEDEGAVLAMTVAAPAAAPPGDDYLRCAGAFARRAGCELRVSGARWSLLCPAVR